MTKIYLFQSGVKCRINSRMLDFSAKARKVLRKNRSLIRKANFAVPNHENYIVLSASIRNKQPTRQLRHPLPRGHMSTNFQVHSPVELLAT